MAEQRICNPQVVGSKPTPGSNSNKGDIMIPVDFWGMYYPFGIDYVASEVRKHEGAIALQKIALSLK